LRRIRKEAVVSYYKILHYRLLTGTKEKYKESQARIVGPGCHFARTQEDKKTH
jgi:hypothetical protein